MRRGAMHCSRVWWWIVKWSHHFTQNVCDVSAKYSSSLWTCVCVSVFVKFEWVSLVSSSKILQIDLCMRVAIFIFVALCQLWCLMRYDIHECIDNSFDWNPNRMKNRRQLPRFVTMCRQNDEHFEDFRLWICRCRNNTEEKRRAGTRMPS